MSTTVERHYQMTRISAGDYIFPSNDGQKLWRVARYFEDGSLETSDGRIIRGTFWRCAKFHGSLDRADRLMQRDPDEFLSWENWYEWDTLIPTRAEAIRSALREAATTLEP